MNFIIHIVFLFHAYFGNRPSVKIVDFFFAKTCLKVWLFQFLVLILQVKIIGSSTTEFTLVDYPTADEPNSNVTLKSSGRLKQEVNNGQTSLFKF